MDNNERAEVLAVVTMPYKDSGQLWDAAVLACGHWVWMADHDEDGDRLSYVGAEVFCDEVHES